MSNVKHNYLIGDKVIYKRADNDWGHIRNERISAVVVGTTPRRVRIRLLHSVKSSFHVLVAPERLERMKEKL